MAEIILPSGISDKDIQIMRQMRMEELINFKRTDTYSEWVLAGELHESFNPSVALALFPMAAKRKGSGTVFKIIPQISEYVENHEPIITYWKRIQALNLPQRAMEYEAKYFERLSQVGDQVLNAFLPNLGINLMPTAMVVFSRPDPHIVTAAEESVFLFCPTVIPPTATFRHLQFQVQGQLRKLSSSM